MGVLTVTPIEDPSNHDKIVLAGVTSLGVCEVSGADREYEWDVKRSAGSQGQTITYRGWDIAKPKVKFRLWTKELQLDFYSRIVPVLEYDADKTKPKPVDVYHPKLFANNIFWLVTTKIGELVDEGKQDWCVTVEFLEYRQAKAKNATTTPESATNGSGTKPTVLDDQDRELEKLREEFNRPS